MTHSFPVLAGDADLAVIMMFGGDNNLSHYIQDDLHEMAAGLGRNTAAIALIDYANAPASVVEVTAADGIRELEGWGEIDTGDPAVLQRFLTRALASYPRARKAIGFWDHGPGSRLDQQP